MSAVHLQSLSTRQSGEDLVIIWAAGREEQGRMEMTEGIYRHVAPDEVNRPSMDKHEETDTGEFPCNTSNSRENLEAPSPQPSGEY